MRKIRNKNATETLKITMNSQPRGLKKGGG
jgi:hypothetical protein